ncbi:MAG: hypothetical protein JRH09_08625 [Deltaproteobacteria bacterium]|nr:hypothetical protein [Deltaproteobacteria bacterium]
MTYNILYKRIIASGIMSGLAQHVESRINLPETKAKPLRYATGEDFHGSKG